MPIEPHALFVIIHCNTEDGINFSETCLFIKNLSCISSLLKTLLTNVLGPTVALKGHGFPPSYLGFPPTFFLKCLSTFFLRLSCDLAAT